MKHDDQCEFSDELSGKTISVVFADDHALVADGMTTILHGVNHKQRGL